MLLRPVIEFNLNRIRHNAVLVKEACEKMNICPMFVTKGFCCAPELVNCMLDVGFTRFGDSRLWNIIKLKKNHPGIYVMLIRSSAPVEAEEVAMWADASIQCEIETVRAISEAAVMLNKVHEIYVNVDVGDTRDGLFGFEQIDEFAEGIKDLPGIKVSGVFTNVGCVGSVIPDKNNTNALADVKDHLNEKFNMNIEHVSFGGTVAFSMINEGEMPERVDEFRFAEAALFGEDTTGHRNLKGFERETIIFKAPIVEIMRKPSVPVGQLGRDAFGNVGVYIDRGIRNRAICSAGKQDVEFNALTLLDPEMIFVGASSDHIIVDLSECSREYKIGEYIDFRCGYMAMLQACTSEYVEKRFV